MMTTDTSKNIEIFYSCVFKKSDSFVRAKNRSTDQTINEMASWLSGLQSRKSRQPDNIPTPKKFSADVLFTIYTNFTNNEIENNAFFPINVRPHVLSSTFYYTPSRPVTIDHIKMETRLNDILTAVSESSVTAPINMLYDSTSDFLYKIELDNFNNNTAMVLRFTTREYSSISSMRESVYEEIHSVFKNLLTKVFDNKIKSKDITINAIPAMDGTTFIETPLKYYRHKDIISTKNMMNNGVTIRKLSNPVVRNNQVYTSYMEIVSNSRHTTVTEGLTSRNSHNDLVLLSHLLKNSYVEEHMGNFSLIFFNALDVGDKLSLSTKAFASNKLFNNTSDLNLPDAVKSLIPFLSETLTCYRMQQRAGVRLNI